LDSGKLGLGISSGWQFSSKLFARLELQDSSPGIGGNRSGHSLYRIWRLADASNRDRPIASFDLVHFDVIHSPSE